MKFEMSDKEEFVRKYKNIIYKNIFISPEQVLNDIWNFANESYSQGYEDGKNYEM